MYKGSGKMFCCYFRKKTVRINSSNPESGLFVALKRAWRGMLFSPFNSFSIFGNRIRNGV